MGCNLISGCHKCKVKVFHFRGEENVDILPFYYKHRQCAEEYLNNVQTVMDNNNTDQDWCEDERFGGYKKDDLSKWWTRKDKLQNNFKNNQTIKNKSKIITEILFVDKDEFSNFQKMVMNKGISQTKYNENPLKCTDNFMEYIGINIWQCDTISIKLHIYTKK